MQKLLEILKEVFGLLRSIVVALGRVVGPLLRGAVGLVGKVLGLAVRYGGPAVRLVWRVLGPVLAKVAVPLVWVWSRIGPRVGPWARNVGGGLVKPVSAGVRIAWREAARIPVLSRRDRALLVEAVGDTTPAWLVRTGSRFDVGVWFRKRRVWACLTDGALVLFAAGKAPLVERTDVRDLKKTRYNHITGELILSPAGNAVVRRLRMPPLDAFELMSLIRDDGDMDSWSISLDEHLDELERAKAGGPVVRPLEQTGVYAPAK